MQSCQIEFRVFGRARAVRFACVLAGFSAVFGCKSRGSDHFAPSTLIEMSEIKREPWMLDGRPRQLGFARDNGIPHMIWKITVDDDKLLEFGGESNTITRIEFGRLSQETYQKLMQRYGGQNFVAYDPDHNYWLEDFLPPKVQAYVNRWFFPQEEVREELPWEVGDFRSARFLGKKPPTSSVGMNCWTILLDVYRDYALPTMRQTAKFFYVNADNAREQFEKNALAVPGRTMEEYSISLKDQSPNIRNKGREIGDLLYIKTQFQPFGPAHVAMWIDEDLYFEKTNFSENDPIRLAFFEQVVGPYLDQDDPNDPARELKFRFYPQSLVNDESQPGAAIPDPQSFSGDYPFEEVPGTETTRAQVLQKLDQLGIRQKYYFTLDTGLGGGLTAYSISSHMSFPIGRDSKSAEKVELQRASILGAEKLSSFSADEVFCSSESGDERFDADVERKFDYQLNVNGDLLVRSRITGNRVANLSGFFMPEETNARIGNNLVIQSEQVRKLAELGRATLTEKMTENILVFPVTSTEPNRSKLLTVFVPKDSNRPVFLEHPGELEAPIELTCDGDIRSLARSMPLANTSP